MATEQGLGENGQSLGGFQFFAHFLLIAALGGCTQVTAPIRLEPTSGPPTFIVVSPGTTRLTASHLTGTMVHVKLRDATTGQRIAKASLSFQGPTLAGGVSGATFDLNFGPLASGSYRLRVAAGGYATVYRDLTLAGRPEKGRKTPDLHLEIALDPGGAAVVGMVADERTGLPIAGARVYAAGNYAYTGRDGRFRLDGLPPGARQISVRKTGYATPTPQTGQPGEDVGLILLIPSRITLNFANASAIFGQLGAQSVLEGLTMALRSAGATVVEDSSGSADVQLVVGPNADFSSRVNEVLDRVKQGGKLVVLGEWGGLASFSPEVAQALLHSAGMAIEPDVVRGDQAGGKPEWPIALARLPYPETKEEVMLFQPASVFAIAPAVPVLTVPGGYRVSGLGAHDPVVGAAAPYGDGFVLALGDTSAWMDLASSASGPNLAVKDNRSFVVKMILW